MDKLIAEKLPPFSHLESFLILPAEMVIHSRFRYFEGLEMEFPDWRQWEMRQSLIWEENGYQAELAQTGISDMQGFVDSCGLGVRNRFIRRLQEILNKNSFFLSGIIMPQILWQDLAVQLADSNEEISLLYRENGSYLHISYRNGELPRLRWHYGNGDNSGSDEKNRLLREVCRELSEIRAAIPGGNSGSLFAFRDNFDEEEIRTIEDSTRFGLREIPAKILPEKGYSPGQIEYLMAYCARKKITELYIGS